MNFELRSEVPEAYTWDLHPMYSTLDDWKRELKELESGPEAISKFQGKLASSSASLESAVKTYLEFMRKLEKLYTYAHLLSDQDTGNSENLGYLDQATNLYTRFGAASSYITPELLAISSETLDRFLAESSLAPYRRFIRDIVRYRKHTLSEPEENLLAQGAEIFGSCSRVFSQLNNADLTFEPITVDGKEEPLTHGNFVLHLKNRERAVREHAYRNYYATYDAHKNTIASTLTGSIKRDVYLAKVRNYPSALESALFPDDVPLTVYNQLIAVVNEFMPAVHRYYEVRRKILKLKELEMYDMYVPIAPEVKLKHTFEEGCSVLLDAFKPLGTEYTEVLGRGLLKERWVDVFENKGKRSGAYSSGCYDSAPYMLMNYKEEEIGDVFTLAHEAGHSMHTYFASKHQPYQDSGYTIFVAEVASTFNEQLLLHHLREKYRDNKPVLQFLINHQLDEIKGTLIRQTMFAEFEKITHEIIERNEPLTVDQYRSIYQELLTRYFGAGVNINPSAWLESLRIPHFYSAFYVYKYATGLSAAIALSEKVLAGESGALERYLNFLKSGGSKYPLELLKIAGVDISSPEPVRAALRLFSKLIEDLERCI